MVQQTGNKFDAIDSIDTARRIWEPIFAKYNLTKRGLLGEGYLFDGADYDAFIRQGPEQFISQVPDLRSFLTSFPSHHRKVIFTNAPEASARQILTLLGVDDVFEDVLGTDFLGNKVCKPERAAFEKVLTYLSVEPSSVCYFEDSFKNLMAGKELGMTTVFVTSSTLVNEGRLIEDLAQFDAVVENKVGWELQSKIPKLWDASNP